MPGERRDVPTFSVNNFNPTVPNSINRFHDVGPGAHTPYHHQSGGRDLRFELASETQSARFQRLRYQCTGYVMEHPTITKSEIPGAMLIIQPAWSKQLLLTTPPGLPDRSRVEYRSPPQSMFGGILASHTYRGSRCRPRQVCSPVVRVSHYMVKPVSRSGHIIGDQLLNAQDVATPIDDSSL